jgi:Flp pilus assembly pilin Flp
VLVRLIKDESGQTLFEYAAIGFLIAVLVIGTIGLITGALNSMLGAVAGAF